MKKNHLGPAWIGAIAIAAFAPAAFGDSPCYADYRDTTPAERAKMNSVLEKSKSAMPAPPGGWQLTSDDAVSGPQSFWQDCAIVPLTYDFTRFYQQVGDAEERKKRLEDQTAS